MQIKRNFRPILNVGQLINGPVRYDKPSEGEKSGSLRSSIKPPVSTNSPKLQAPAPNLSLSGGMKQAEAKALESFADSVKKGTPDGPKHVDSAKDPSLLEGMGRAFNDLRTVTKAPIDAATSYIPGVHAGAKIPGKLYEGAAKLVPDAIKDARILGHRVGDAADAVAQTFSPVSLDPNATPADHLEQAAMAWSGGKLLGKGAQALGKHGGKIVNGAGLGAMFGPDAVAGAADHVARMFGREVPSMATAGGPRLPAPHTPAPRPVPHQAHMTAPNNVPSQFKDMAASSTPPPIPPEKPGFLKRAGSWVMNHPVLGGAVGGAAVLGPAAGIGYGIRKTKTASELQNLPDNLKGWEQRAQRDSERSKSAREHAYKIAAERRAAEKQRNIQRQQQQGGR